MKFKFLSILLLFWSSVHQVILEKEMFADIIKFDNDILQNQVSQVAMVVPNWKKAVLPWMQLGKKFQKIRLSKEIVSNYFVNGEQKEVDFIVDVIITPDTYELEFLCPLQGDTMYSQFLQIEKEGGLQHFVYRPQNDTLLKEFQQRLQLINIPEIVTFKVGENVIAHYYQFPSLVLELWEFLPPPPDSKNYYVDVTWDDFKNINEIK